MRKWIHRNSGPAALVLSLIAVMMSMTGLGSAATHAVKHAVTTMIAGHKLTTKAQPGAIPVLGKNGKLAAGMIPSVGASKLGGETRAQLTGSCPTGTANLGTWCLMITPYPLTTAEQEQGVNDYNWAAQACAQVGGFLPDAAQLIGAAKRVRLESTVTDNPATATIEGGDPGTPATNQNEMSATLVTTAAGSDAAGSEGVSADTVVDPESGEPQPLAEPANPMPSTLQYVTVYSNGQAGGFAGSEPVSTPDNFRCGFDLKQSAAK